VSEAEVMFTSDLTSLARTMEFAAALGAALRAGDLVLLEGGLGAGKTTLVQGLARGMGLASAVKSPTYTLVHEHPAARAGGPRLGHLDLYRIPTGRDLGDLGLEELLGRGAVVVEWGARLFAPDADALLLTLEGPPAGGPEDARQLRLCGRGPRGAELAALAVAHLAPAPQVP